MKFKLSIALFLVASVLVSCSKSIEYSEAFKNNTSGKYLYNPDELILVYYEGNTLYLNWKGGKVAHYEYLERIYRKCTKHNNKTFADFLTHGRT